MSRKFNTFTISAIAITLLSGIVLTGCSSSDDDANQCCPKIGWHDNVDDDTVSDDSTGDIAGIMAAEDGEFSILPVEEPIVIDDQETGGGDGNDGNSLQDQWQEHLDNHQGNDGEEVDLSVL